MSEQKILTKQIKDYLLSNPSVIDRSKPSPYVKVAEKFGVHTEVIRSIWKRLRKIGLVEIDNHPITTVITTGDIKDVLYRESGDTAELNRHFSSPIKSLEDLVEKCEIDTETWAVHSWECKTTTINVKNKDGETVQEQKYWVGAKLRKRQVDKDIELQKNELLDLVKTHSPVVAKKSQKSFGKNILLELSLPDVHFGKMSWREESGEDYDLKIAVERFKEAIADLLAKTPLEYVERILFPIGNDMINIDSRKNMTTAGTPQDTDSRFKKLLSVVKDLLVQTISELSEIAPVDVVVVSGNHDYDTMFTLGMVLEGYFHNNENVNIDNSPKQRKYYKYYNTGILLTHGNEEKHGDLGLIFATEEPHLWASTLFREAQLGHYHKNKRINYVSVDEYQGFQIQILPSLSGTDFWHSSKGYMGLKQAKAFLYEREQGKIAEFNFTVKQ